MILSIILTIASRLNLIYDEPDSQRAKPIHTSPRYTLTTIIDGIKDNVGRCSVQPGEYNTKQLCVTEGGSWKYVMDISGISNIVGNKVMT